LEKEQSLKFSIYQQIFVIKELNKTAASAALLENCILLHAYARTTAAPSNCVNTNKCRVYA